MHWHIFYLVVFMNIVSRHPPLKWAQRADVLFIKIDLPDAKDVKLKLEPEGEQGECRVESYVCNLIKKEESKWWNRLLKQEGKTPAFVKVDWDNWVDEDEMDEKLELIWTLVDMDFSQLNLGGGGGFDAEGVDDDEDSDTEEEEEEKKEGESIGKKEVATPLGNQVEAGA
ncbi:putative HSP20-like chaperone [Helianthus annuus]|nr:putative HSP20-like chaperone [Helianthus annuus]